MKTASSWRKCPHCRDEALQNIREAIAVYLESLKAHDEPVPPAIDEEVVEVAE